MNQGMQRTASGQFELPLAAREAMWLFTPEGERAWVPGWDPWYPAGRASEAPGTVFTTSVSGVETTWVIIQLDRSRSHAVYARITPGHHAGMVSVTCSDTRPGHCDVRVQYHLTTIGGAQSSVLDSYGPEQFAAMLDHWQAAVERYLGQADQA